MDDPHEPPCVRCRRESKECVFSATRRKRKLDGEESEPGDQDQAIDDYAERNGRRILKAGSVTNNALQNPPQGRKSLTLGSLTATPPLHNYSLEEQPFDTHTPYATGGAIRDTENGGEEEVGNDTAAQLFQSPINIPTDALHLLLEASNKSEDLHRRELQSQQRRSAGLPITGLSSSRNIGSVRALGDLKHESNIDPAIAGDRAQNGRSPIPRKTLDVWSRLRFVRAGWFTAREGIAYVN